jgi:hypothetical protein
MPIKLTKRPASIEPPALGSVAVKVEEKDPEATSREPGLVLVVAGNWLRIDAGTVKVFCPAVVRQMNVLELVTALVPVPVVMKEPPMISTVRGIAAGQLRVRPALRFTVLGNPPVTMSGEPRVRANY